MSAQTINRLPATVDSVSMVTLRDHHPAWATASNLLGPVPEDQSIGGLTLVLSRSPEQEAAFHKLLADQQDRTSPDYHRWLTPGEIGSRFGLSDQDVSSIKGWLASQSLKVTFVAPSKMFIGFSGTAGQVSAAFHSRMATYRVNDAERMSVEADPMIPVSLAPVIKGIRGLYTIDEQPLHGARAETMTSPNFSLSSTTHYLTPEDFSTIYNIPTGIGGSAQTIGIVGRSRVNINDISNFTSKIGVYLQGPDEIIPTAFGGVDPGPAYTTPPPAGTSLEDQLEATLDVTRAGSIAASVQLDLVVATDASGGIATSAQYLVQTTPVPAQIMNISFGSCESAAGQSGVAFWDTLFQQAAGEGISVFVSSGDAGASGCDANFGTPPTIPEPNSPNYICSSSYATCVGGTEFNDTANPAVYWNTNNDTNLGSALSYIPEGAWNEPLTSKSAPQAAASAGGVSSIIATPSWQTGTGVPSARAGRYTPDLAFSASGHDGYFACFAAAGASCVNDSNGGFQFEYFYGTSAAAPDMAGITALLIQNLGTPVGNLNPELYSLAAGSSSPFHDVTVATSGVSNCKIGTPSICNNSIPGPTGLSGGQPGYLVGTGYDEVTGLGSLNVSNFITSYVAPKTTPQVEFDGAHSITTAQPLSISAGFTGRTNQPPTGTAILSGGGYTSAAVTLQGGGADFNIPAGTLTIGTDVLTVQYTPDATASAIYNPVSSTVSVTVTSVPLITPPLGVIVLGTSVSTAELLPVEFSFTLGSGNAVPSGTITVVSGSYKSAPVKTLSGNVSLLTIPAWSLAVGNDTLTATYTPDATSAKIYTSSMGTGSITVTKAAVTAPAVNILPGSFALTTAQSLDVQVSVSEGVGFVTGTGTIIVTAGTFTSPVTALTGTPVTVTIPAGALPVGTATINASYTPDAQSSGVYSSATGSTTVQVTAPPTPAIAITGSSVTVAAGASSGNTSAITVTPGGGFTGAVALTATVTSSPTGAVHAPTLSFGSTGSVSITGTAAGTGTLTISTTAQGSCPQANLRASRSSMPWFAASGATLAGAFLLGFPASKKRRIPGVLLLLVALSAGVTACGGSGGETSTCNVITPGTTAGSYTLTVTGTSGSVTSTGTVNLTVQ